MYQMSVFDILEGKSENWQELSHKEIAERIAAEFGKVPVLDRFGDYAFEIKPYTVSICLGRYTTLDERKGKLHIGVHIDNRKALSGSACPCDSIEEAIRRIRGVTEKVL